MLLKNSIIFILGEILNKSFPFFMLPVLTKYLSQESFGLVAMFTLTTTIFSFFSGLSIHGAISVKYYKLKKKEFVKYVGNCLLILVTSTLIISILVFIFFRYFSSYSTFSMFFVYLSLLIAFMQFITTINLTLWMVEQKATPYIFYQLGQTLFGGCLTLFLIIYVNFEWQGSIYSLTLTSILFGVLSLYFLKLRGFLKISIDDIYIKDALEFGIPLIPHNLSGWLSSGADRLLLAFTLGSASVGVYSVAFQIGMVISVLATAFNRAWNPFLFKTLSSNPTYEDKVKIIKITYLYIVSLIFIAFIFNEVVQLIFPFFIGNNFLESSEYIFYFSLAMAFKGGYFMVSGYYFYTNKTKLLTYITVSVAASSLIVLYYMIDQYGILGAAITTLISNFITFMLTCFISNKIYSMPWVFWKVKHE